MSEIRFTVDVLPLVPVMHMYFDFFIVWSISISVVILQLSSISFRTVAFFFETPGLIIILLMVFKFISLSLRMR